MPLREPPPPPPFAINDDPAIVIDELNPFCPFVPAVLFPIPPLPTFTVMEVPAAILQFVVNNTCPPPPPPPTNPPAPPPATTNISAFMSSGIVKVYDVCPVKPALSLVYVNTNNLSYVKNVVVETLDVAGETTEVVISDGKAKVGNDVLS